jgi:hypothetical protein
VLSGEGLDASLGTLRAESEKQSSGSWRIRTAALSQSELPRAGFLDAQVF